MPEAAELIPAAARATTAVVEAIGADGWDAPSPCEGWTVRDVLNHLTSEHLWAPHLLRGETIAQVGDRYDGDVLGADPVAAWTSAVEASILAWADPDRVESVHTSMGELPTAEYARQMLIDLTVHGWDLAAPTGVDYEPVAEAVEDGIAYEQPRLGSGESGGLESIFSAPVHHEGDGRLGDLLGLTGRPAYGPGGRGGDLGR